MSGMSVMNRTIQIKPPYIETVDLRMGWNSYCGAVGLNPSRWVQGLRSMKHLKHGDGAEKPHKETLVGSATHCLVFEPEKFYERFAIYTGSRRQGKAWNEFLAEHAGKDILKENEHSEASEVAHHVVGDRIAESVLRKVNPEVSLFAELNGVQCKGRVDGLGNGILLDLKTTTNVSMYQFGRVFANLRYAEKLAAYRALCRKHDIAVNEVYIIAAETKAPYDVTVTPVPELILDQAWERMERLLERVKECVETDYWPGTAEGDFYELHVPNWAMDDDVLDWSE